MDTDKTGADRQAPAATAHPFADAGASGEIPAGRPDDVSLGTTSAERRRFIESFGISHPGKVRPANEDHFAIVSLQKSVQLRQTNLDDPHVFDRLAGPKGYLYAVADGVGGHAGGRKASGMAVETIVEYLGEAVGFYNGLGVERAEEFPNHLSRAVQRAHENLVETFKLKGRGGPATTLTMALIVWPRAYVVHVGDSRAYHLRGGTLRRLTRDQTMGEFLVTQHGMPAKKAEEAGLYNVLASAVGAEDMMPAVAVAELERGDTLLLCTDGLTKHVTEDKIREVLMRDWSAEPACRVLVEIALEDGGTDNVTAVVVKMLPG